MNELGIQFFILPLTAAMASFALLPLLIRSRALPLDMPNERSLHVAPVPRSGGIAIMLPVIFGGWIYAAEMRPLLACTAALSALSFLDDKRPISPALRLLAHALAAIFFIMAAFPTLAWAQQALLLLAIVWMTNLYNFMDGSDGLAGGMAAIGFGAYAYLAASGGHAALAVVAASLSACALMFLVFNFHPARIFMGDTGSVGLGFLAATLGALGWREGAWPLLVPVLVFSPFIVDASLTLLRRLVAGEKLWQAHRSHYYQRLVAMGWGHRATALYGYGLMGAVSLSAVVFAHALDVWQWLIPAAWVVIYALLALFIDRRWRRHHEGPYGSV